MTWTSGDGVDGVDGVDDLDDAGAGDAALASASASTGERGGAQWRITAAFQRTKRKQQMGRSEEVREDIRDRRDIGPGATVEVDLERDECELRRAWSRGVEPGGECRSCSQRSRCKEAL